MQWAGAKGVWGVPGPSPFTLPENSARKELLRKKDGCEDGSLAGVSEKAPGQRDEDLLQDWRGSSGSGVKSSAVPKHPSFFISWRVFYTPVTQTLLHVRSSRECKKFLVPKPHPRPIKFMSLLEDSGTCVFQSSQVIVMFSQVVNLQSTCLPEFSISSEVQCPVL